MYGTATPQHHPAGAVLEEERHIKLAPGRSGANGDWPPEQFCIEQRQQENSSA